MGVSQLSVQSLPFYKVSLINNIPRSETNSHVINDRGKCVSNSYCIIWSKNNLRNKDILYSKSERQTGVQALAFPKETRKLVSEATDVL